MTKTWIYLRRVTCFYVFYFEKEHLSIDFGPGAASFRLLKNC